MDRADVSDYIESGLESLRNQDIAKAQATLEAALAINFEDARVVGLLKYVAYWKERLRTIDSFPSNFEKSDYLLQQWSGFQAFVDRVAIRDDDILYTLRHLVFGKALSLLSIYNNESGTKDPEVLYRVGVCLKGVGNYDAAKRFLEGAQFLKKDDPAILADLADAYALIGETNLSKVFFREAFFLNAQNVRLETLECEMILRLIRTVRDQGYSGQELSEWIPVYGHLHGVLTVKRELRALEYGKLLQNIYNLERELMEGPTPSSVVLPRLLYRYFWLIDHYSQNPQDYKRLQTALLKIRSLAPHIYEQYTK